MKLMGFVMDGDKKVKRRKFEKRLYEFLGVRFFRVLVFQLERFLHRKDGKKNTNYHIALYEQAEINAFVKYLFYNGTIHFRNLLFFLTYFAIHYIATRSFAWYNVLPFLLMIKDIYCIMLQRYNFLRIEERRTRLETKQQLKIMRKADRILSEGLPNYDRRYVQEDLALVRKISDCIKNRQTIILTKEEENALSRLKDIIINGREE